MRRPFRDPENAAAAFVLFALACIAAALLGGFFLGRSTKSSTTVSVSTPTIPTATTVSAQVAAGAHDFVNFACAQCHGLDGRGGVSPYVPALKNTTLTTAELTHIINHGLGESANPTHPYMPVWGQVISARQVDDLVAYIHAGLPKVPTAAPADIPQGQGLAVEGQTLYTLYGCINCHGPNGLGGVPEPAVARQVDPAAVRRRLLQAVRHGREDQGRDRVGQRDRPRADRQHAALGRHHPTRPARCSRRLHQDAEDRLT